MYIWRNKQRRDKRANATDGHLTWGPPKGTYNDEIIRQKNEALFVSTFVKRIRVIISNYLATENGAIEINHVISEIQKINNANDTSKNKTSIPPELKKRKNVYEIFRKFDLDGSDTIDLEELVVLLRHLGVKLEEEELSNVMADLNTNGTGEITFDEFYAWFEKEGERQKAKSKWKVSLFKKKDPNDDIYANFKRMVMEVEARNLIIDKVVYETERDALKEFRIAHPALMCCPHCTDCFLHPNDLHTHAADSGMHEAKAKAEAEMLRRFAPVQNAFLGAFGRKLTAHRLLFSVELNGMQARLDVVSEQPYRPNIADPKGRRAEQLRKKALVLGADARAGVRPMYIHNNLAIQHRTTWQTDHGGLTLQDTLTELLHIRDEPIDVCMVSTLGGHVEVNIEWRGYIRYDIYLIGEFNGWKPEMMYPRPDGVYSSLKVLAPGRYQYRFIADGVEKYEESASTTINGGKTNNTLLVVNPLVKSEGLTLPKSINLRNSLLYDGGVNVLARCMQKNSHIECLDLSYNNISDEGMLSVAEACNCLLRLKVLKLNGNGFTYDGCRYLAETYSSSEHLEVLEMCGNRIADDGAEIIGKSLERHKRLEVLNLDSNFIGDDGASCLGTSLQFNKVLKILTLAGNMIRTAGSERLCFFLRNNGTLKELNLSGNPLGPDGVRNVGDMLLYAENLEVLDISHTQMMLAQSSQGLLSVTTSLRRNRGLKVLKLKGNGLDNDAALEIAYGMSGNRTVIELDLSNNPIVSQWFEPDTYLKTKLLAKMPTIQTSLDRNIRIQNDPELHARWQVRPKEYDDNPAGTWTKRRKWKPDKTKEVVTDTVDVYEGEDIRQRAEEDFIVDGLFAHAVTVTEFLDSKEGARFITCVAKLIVHYARSLSIQKDNAPEWLDQSHYAVISALLCECQQECDAAKVPIETNAKKLAPILDKKETSEKSLPINPPPLVEEFVQVVPAKCISIFFRKLAIKLDNEKLQDVIDSCVIHGESEEHVIGVRKFVKLFVKNYSEYVPSGINGSLSRMFLKPPVALARQLIYTNSINTKRMELRQHYRSQLDKRPLFICNGCGKRFSSFKAERKHLERIKKDHLKFANIEELWLSQNHFLRRAKYLQSGCHFPTYYELGDTILLPRYYCPQIFDKWGDEGRPIGVIEPNLTYKTEDILGSMIQVRYSGGLGWTHYKLGAVTVMHPSMAHKRGFWDDLESFPKPIFYQVSDVLPDGVEIKVRQRPDKDAVVCGALEKGMVVTCEAQKGNWLQIRFNDFDSVWVYETSGEIALLERLHKYLQVKMPNITNHKSPCRVEPHLLELTPQELRAELLIKRQEKKEAEEAALVEAEAKTKKAAEDVVNGGENTSPAKKQKPTCRGKKES